MTNANIREAHRIITNAGSVMTREQIDLLRSVLPPLPKQKTLEEITEHVYDAWVGTNGDEWPDDVHGGLETWLAELHAQLQGIAPAEPAHPEFLETEADYQYAPEGTIAAQDNWPVWMKEEANDWTCSAGAVGNYSMAQSRRPRRVLRFGWDNE